MTSTSSGYFNELYDDILCQPYWTCDPATGTPIAVTLGNNTLDIDFALATGGSISGTIIDAGTNNAIPDVRVAIIDSNGNEVASDYTDNSGLYSAGGLFSGTYYATTYNWSGYIDELYDDILCEPWCDPTTGTAIDVTPGNDTSGIDFALVMGGSISGTITDGGTGLPAEDIEVDIFDSTTQPAQYSTR